MTVDFWLTWISAFFVVIAALMVGVVVSEYLLWKKER